MTIFDFADVPTLETDRVRLRRIVDADLDAWLSVWRSAGALDYLIDFDGAPDDRIAAEIIQWAQRIFDNKSGIRWAVTLKPADNMIGSCGFHLYERRHHRAEVGYELHSDHWRRGIMSEALAAVLRFCFERLGLRRVEADVVEGNAASAALLKKLGFNLEGIWRDRVYGRGAFHSLWQFSLLEPDYRALGKVERGG